MPWTCAWYWFGCIASRLTKKLFLSRLPKARNSSGFILWTELNFSKLAVVHTYKDVLWWFPYLSHTYSSYWGEYFHLRYPKLLVNCLPIHHHPPNLSCCIKIWRDSEAFLVGGHLWVCASAHYDTCLHLLRAVHLCAHFTAQFVEFRCLTCGFHTCFQVRIWTTSVVQLLHISFYVWNEEMHSCIAS